MYTKVYSINTMTHLLPVTQARKDLLKLVDKVSEEYTRVDLTKNGKIKATLVSPEYLDSLEETIYSLKHSLKDIQEARKEFAQGKFIDFDDFKKRLRTK